MTAVHKIKDKDALYKCNLPFVMRRFCFILSTEEVNITFCNYTAVWYNDIRNTAARRSRPFLPIMLTQRGFCHGQSIHQENKNIYQLTREGLKLTRDAASELLESIPPERIEKIENERSLPHPDEVLTMADKYKKPDLCNYYCANQCPIGQEYVPEIKIKDLSQIVLEMLASLNAMNKRKDRLIEITADGTITPDELEDFVFIQQELERISITVETLQLWAEKMLATGIIDEVQYEACRKRHNS